MKDMVADCEVVFQPERRENDSVSDGKRQPNDVIFDCNKNTSVSTAERHTFTQLEEIKKLLPQVRANTNGPPSLDIYFVSLVVPHDCVRLRNKFSNMPSVLKG